MARGAGFHFSPAGFHGTVMKVGEKGGAECLLNPHESAMKRTVLLLALLAATALTPIGRAAAQTPRTGIDTIDTVVVIYAENRSFDNLYGAFPGANGLQNVTAANSRQRDRDGSPMK